MSELFLNSAHAPQPRTLWDIFQTTVQAYPEATAIDDGEEVLTYAELDAAVRAQAATMAAAGVRRGDRVGIRMASGHAALYISILATLASGAAYVPVDADDPDERAELVFSEAEINALLSDEGLRILSHRPANSAAHSDPTAPALEDDAWIIFTSGSTGTPKGVAVTHRSAAAFVDAEALLFVQDDPLGPDDRVLAGLSVAFDASCEEMWLAWRHGACLVPAPRALVRSGMDLGPWLIRRSITVVSTVPTLAGLWPAEALDHVRLLIVGGEACSQELVERLATPDREMWNTYGPTEATVVATAQQLRPGEEVGIGTALAGWDVVVVDKQDRPVNPGEVGELVIGGVGLARYLDPEKDRERYAPMGPWERAYRTGDHVRLEADGLYFVGRVDDQVKIGGRRIELGEVEAAVSGLPGVYNSAVAVQTTASGENLLVGYVSLEPGAQWDPTQAQESLAESMPAALVPRIHVMEGLPVRNSGKVDKDALPWPLPDVHVADNLSPIESWLAQLWVDVLGASVSSADDDFFSLGGSSLAAATLVAAIRERVPTVAVRDLYDHPRLGALAQVVEQLAKESGEVVPENAASSVTPVRPVRVKTRVAQLGIQLVTMTLRSSQWLAWALLLINILAWPTVTVPWWLVAGMLLVFATPLGCLPLGAAGARLLTAGIAPGVYPRGGAIHLRIWAAERWVDASGARSISASTWVTTFARLLGASIGCGVDLHSLPPVTGLLTVDSYAAIEPEVDLSGYWLDGDQLRVGEIRIGQHARIGARSTLLPGTIVGDRAHVEAGSTVTGEKKIKAGTRWSGSPAAKVGRSKHRFPNSTPSRRPYWVLAYALGSLGLALLPLFAIACGIAVVVGVVRLGGWYPPLGALLCAPLGALVTFLVSMVATWLGVRVLSIGIRSGVTPVRSFLGWRIWMISRLMDDARWALFPLYASHATPWWFRALGARIGSDVEISTAISIPALMEVRDGAFLADDTLIGGYELGSGWLLAGPTVIGKRSFVGNSGITLPGRKLAKNSLVAVQSSTPKKAKAGSNWWGSPPERMRRVEVDAQGGEARTYSPGRKLKLARGAVEVLRLLAPMTSGVIFAAVLLSLMAVCASAGFWAAWLSSGLILMTAGLVAVTITDLVKWLCVGEHTAGEHPLYSRFVWLNELQDAFVETLAAPWFFNHAAGTAEMNVALRALGVHVGKGAWIESYWFPETDLCFVGDGATVGPGTVVQTHLFQDRVMSLGAVTIEAGATLGAHSVALPASHIARDASVGPGSLVMRGDQVPAATRWQGNPIEPVGG